MRTFSLGSDRYTRSYWLLPSSGGIFVEGADTSQQKDSTVKRPRKLSVIEEGNVGTLGQKRKLSVKSEACVDDVFEAPAIKKSKEDDETESDVDTMNLSLLSDVCQQQAKEFNSQDEAMSSRAQTPASSPSPSQPTCNEPHPSGPNSSPKNTTSVTSQPIRSCVITGHCPQESNTTDNNNCSRENSIEPPADNDIRVHNQTSNTPNTEDNNTDIQTTESSMYMNSQQQQQPTMAYLSNGSLVYSTMPQGSVQYVIPQQGGYMIQEPSTGAVAAGDSTVQYIQAGQLIQGPDGVQYLAVQNSMMPSVPQSHNLAYIQMENGEQQLCVINNGGVTGNNETLNISDGTVYSMSVPAMEVMGNEVECMPHRHNILLLMLEMSMQYQPTKEEKDTGPSLEELLSQVNPSELL